MPEEAAATSEPGGGSGGPVDVSWLILQRLEDLRRAQDDLRKAQDELKAEIKGLDAKLSAKIDAVDAKIDSKVDSLREDLERKIESVRGWSLGLLLLAILGLLAKLLIPNV